MTIARRLNDNCRLNVAVLALACWGVCGMAGCGPDDQPGESAGENRPATVTSTIASTNGSTDAEQASSQTRLEEGRPETPPNQLQPPRSATGHAPILVEARGHEFHWEFFTVGPDGQPGTGDEKSLGNDLPAPANTLITLILSSDDYIYTLNTPDGRIAPAVPELIHTIQFRSPPEGRHEFRTDPMCGLRYFHDDVLGTMSVLTTPGPPSGDGAVTARRGDRP